MITSLKPIKLCAVGVYFLLLIIYCDANDKDTLELVHVIFRHGSRTTDKNEFYPNDPYGRNNVYPTSYGQLTNKGKQQAYQLGKLLRKKYKDFLDGEIPSEAVWTETSEFPRTQVSALLVLAGLFPPTAAEKWSDELNWTPIPYYSREQKHDFVLWKPKKCPVYGREFERLLKSEQVSNFIKQHSQTLNYVTERSGKEMNDLNDVFRLHQVLDSEAARNLSLPNWTENVFPKELKVIATQKLVYENGTPLLKRLYIGRILKIILNRMQEKSENALNPNKKLILYSGHDNNVLGVLVALNLAPYEFPEYCSAVLIELHKSKSLNKYYVKVFHVRNVESEPEEKHIFNCKGACFLSEFKSLLQPIIPGNLTEECGSTELLE